MGVAEDLVAARIAAGLSQRSLAALTGVAQPTIARIERGQADPRWTTLDVLLKACGARVAVEIDAPPPRSALEPEDWASIRANLELTPTERAEKNVAWARLARELRLATKRPST